METKYNKIELFKLGFNLMNNPDLDEEISDFISEAIRTIFNSMWQDDKDFTIAWLRTWEQQQEEEQAEEEKEWDSVLNNIVKKVFCRICGAYSGDSEHICNILLSE